MKVLEYRFELKDIYEVHKYCKNAYVKCEECLNECELNYKEEEEE